MMWLLALMTALLTAQIVLAWHPDALQGDSVSQRIVHAWQQPQSLNLLQGGAGTATCGANAGNATCPYGQCCNMLGNCGNGAKFCKPKFCQPKFGVCNPAPTSKKGPLPPGDIYASLTFYGMFRRVFVYLCISVQRCGDMRLHDSHNVLACSVVQLTV
jgi:hypothetical protein